MNTTNQKSQEALVPRSILKQPKSQSTAPQSQDDRNRETALHHANLIQQRKDVEYLILSSIEALIDLPSSPNADPTRPLPSDTLLVKNSLEPFQPSDYDALIAERNINRQCGYVFCPRPNRKQDTKAKYRIIHGRGKGPDALRFVETESLEKWCSDDCGKRALYIKVQLKEEPAWARGSSKGGDIAFLDDGQGAQNDMESLTTSMQGLEMDQTEEEMIQKLKALAIERGNANAPSRSFGLAEIEIKEKQGSGGVQVPSQPQSDNPDEALMIDGYKPKAIFNHVGVSESAKGLEDEEDIIETL